MCEGCGCAGVPAYANVAITVYIHIRVANSRMEKGVRGILFLHSPYVVENGCYCSLHLTACIHVYRF